MTVCGLWSTVNKSTNAATDECIYHPPTLKQRKSIKNKEGIISFLMTIAIRKTSEKNH